MREKIEITEKGACHAVEWPGLPLKALVNTLQLCLLCCPVDGSWSGCSKCHHTGNHCELFSLGSDKRVSRKWQNEWISVPSLKRQHFAWPLQGCLCRVSFLTHAFGFLNLSHRYRLNFFFLMSCVFWKRKSLSILHRAWSPKQKTQILIQLNASSNSLKALISLF